MMNPYPDFCLICGAEIARGINTRIIGTHKMDFGQYCKYFPDTEKGSYGISLIKKAERF